MNCFMCKGHLVDGFVNHIVDMENKIIILKNVPAKVCIQCGEYYLSNEVALSVERIIETTKNTQLEIAVINYTNEVA